MSQFIEIANKFQEQQVAAVKEQQAAFLKFVEEAASKAPEAPQVEVPEAVAEALKPVTDFYGTPEEINAYLNNSVKTWTELAQNFQNAVLAATTKA